mgnify:CR=1 FL=1
MKTIKNMTADQLRKSILQLAIQGKLVKQDPKDEPASVLVEKIYEEKKKLIAEGKIKKEKVESRIFKGDDNRYYEKIGKETKDITDELPFEIPESWEWIKMETANSIVVGATPSTANSSYWSNGSIPWLPSGCCQDCDVLESYPKMKKITEKAYESCSTIMMEPETVLIALTGATAGKVGLLKFKACANQSVVGIKPYLDINPKFLFYQLMARRKEILSDCIGSAQPHISKEYVTKINFALPPLLEQQRIVERIEQIEPLLQQYDKLEKQLTKLENEITDKLKKSILQYAIEGKLVKQDPNDEPASVLLERIKAEKEKLIKEGKIKRDKNESYIYQGDDKNYYEKNTKNNQILDISDYIFDIKKSWKWCTLGQLTKQITDGTHKTPEYTNAGIPFLSIQNISSGKFDLAHLKYISINEHKVLSKRCNPEVNDILLCRIGTLGKPIINKLDFEFSIFVSLGLIKLVLNEPLNYVYLVLSSPHISNFIDFIKVGGGTHTFKINVEDINKFPIPLPPLAEQQRIVNKVERLFNVL